MNNTVCTEDDLSPKQGGEEYPRCVCLVLQSEVTGSVNCWFKSGYHVVSTIAVLVLNLPVETSTSGSLEIKTDSISSRWFLFLLLKMNLEF